MKITNKDVLCLIVQSLLNTLILILQILHIEKKKSTFFSLTIKNKYLQCGMYSYFISTVVKAILLMTMPV